MSKQKKALKQDYEPMYQTLLDVIDVGVHAIDTSGKTMIYNRKMTEIEEMCEEDVINKSLLEVFRFPEEKDSTLLQALLHGTCSKYP